MKMSNRLNISFTEPFGVYLHIPFCARKCSYCDFYSEPLSGGIVQDYLTAVTKEIAFYRNLLGKKAIYSLYIGGGTPSLLSAAQLAGIIELIVVSFSAPLSGEITLEANPSSLDQNKLKAYQKAGVNRLSLGVQSLIDQELKTLGRPHSAAQALATIELIKDYFVNFNLDLILAIPGQTVASWQETLLTVLSFQPPHLSLYNLQLEHNTLLAQLVEAGELTGVDDKLDAELYQLALTLLAERGYQHYEISNFAREGAYSSHNTLYWQYRPYLGLGPAAHSFDGNRRFASQPDLKKYLREIARDQLPLAEITRLTPEEKKSEFLFLGLRLRQGVELARFAELFQQKLEDVYSEKLDYLKKMGLIEISGGYLSLSHKGLFLGNQVFMEFLN